MGGLSRERIDRCESEGDRDPRNLDQNRARDGLHSCFNETMPRFHALSLATGIRAMTHNVRMHLLYRGRLLLLRNGNAAPITLYPL